MKKITKILSVFIMIMAGLFIFSGCTSNYLMEKGDIKSITIYATNFDSSGYSGTYEITKSDDIKKIKSTFAGKTTSKAPWAKSASEKWQSLGSSGGNTHNSIYIINVTTKKDKKYSFGVGVRSTTKNADGTNSYSSDYNLCMRLERICTIKNANSIIKEILSHYVVK